MPSQTKISNCKNYSISKTCENCHPSQKRPKIQLAKKSKLKIAVLLIKTENVFFAKMGFSLIMMFNLVTELNVEKIVNIVIG